MSKWIRILIGFGILVVLGIAYIWFFGVQTFYVWETRKVARTNPLMWTTPVALTDLSISQSPGRKFSYFGYDFEVPWDDVDPVKTRVMGDNKSIIVFRSGNAISFWSADAYGLLSAYMAKEKMDRNSMEQLFGEEAGQSNFAFTRAVLDMTPGRFSPFIPKMQAIQQGSLFMMKVAIMRSSASSGIFSLATKEFNGFQYGRPPLSSPKYVSVELFRDSKHIDIIFGQKPGGPVIISQADVNRVVQSVHGASHPEVKPEAPSQR
jgi:hypothetical protein